MPKTVTIGTETFEIPAEGDEGNYGEQISDWISAASDALATVQQRNDVPNSSASILNNMTTPTSIPGFIFDTSEVISINGEYIITRTTDVPAVNLTESGVIQGNFNGSVWSIAIEAIGNAGVTFSITSDGQIQYTSTNLTGSSYVGEIRFRAKVFNDLE